MNVTFVYPDLLECDPTYQGAFYSGIAILSAVLKREGHATSLIHITNPAYTDEDFLRDIASRGPDLVAFSSTMNGYPLVKRCAGLLAGNRPELPTIYGGIHPSLSPEECIVTPGIRMICQGEGEGCLTDVCAALAAGAPLDNIPGLWLKKGETILRNPARPPLDDLDSLPASDRAIFNYPALYNERQGNATFMASRGCPNSCSYCANKALRGLYRNQGRYVRFRSVANLVTEINAVRARYPFVRRIHFDDDILFLKRDWAREFVREYKDKVGLPFCSNIHPSLCNEENIRLLAEAGCDELRIGLESGDPEIRKTVLNRHMNNDVIIRAFLLAKSFGIKVKSFNMIGLPHEDAAKILATIKLNAHADVDEIQHTIFHPYPGTRLLDLCQEENLLSGRVLTSYYLGSILNLPGLTEEQICMFQRYFHTFVAVYKRVFRLPGPAAQGVEKLLDAVLSLKSAPALLNLANPLIQAAKGMLRLLGVGRAAPPAGRPA